MSPLASFAAHRVADVGSPRPLYRSPRTVLLVVADSELGGNVCVGSALMITGGSSSTLVTLMVTVMVALAPLCESVAVTVDGM